MKFTDKESKITMVATVLALIVAIIQLTVDSTDEIDAVKQPLGDHNATPRQHTELILGSKEVDIKKPSDKHYQFTVMGSNNSILVQSSFSNASIDDITISNSNSKYEIYFPKDHIINVLVTGKNNNFRVEKTISDSLRFNLVGENNSINKI